MLRLKDKLGGSVDTIDTNTIYPVGAVYMSTSSTSPASLFGGN